MYRQGMGIQHNMECHGFGWLLPKFDVHDWMFRDDVKGEMLFANPAIQQAYGARWREIQRGTDNHRVVSRVGELLTAYRRYEPLVTELILLLIRISLRDYRRYVYGLLKKGLREEIQADALAGALPLCWTTLEEVLQEHHGPPHLVTGNKTRYKDPGLLYDFLWDVDQPGVQRLHRDHASFRQLHRAIRNMLRRQQQLRPRSLLLLWTFTTGHRVFFFESNWILPYPDNWVFLQKTKPGLESPAS